MCVIGRRRFQARPRTVLRRAARSCRFRTSPRAQAAPLRRHRRRAESSHLASSHLAWRDRPQQCCRSLQSSWSRLRRAVARFSTPLGEPARLRLLGRPRALKIRCAHCGSLGAPQLGALPDHVIRYFKVRRAPEYTQRPGASHRLVARLGGPALGAMPPCAQLALLTHRARRPFGAPRRDSSTRSMTTSAARALGASQSACVHGKAAARYPSLALQLLSRVTWALQRMGYPSVRPFSCLCAATPALARLRRALGSFSCCRTKRTRAGADARACASCAQPHGELRVPPGHARGARACAVRSVRPCRGDVPGNGLLGRHQVLDWRAVPGPADGQLLFVLMRRKRQRGLRQCCRLNRHHAYPVCAGDRQHVHRRAVRRQLSG